MAQTRECDRCEAVMVNDHYNDSDILRIARAKSGCEWSEWESKEVVLCSACWDDLWEWADGEEIDRSDKADSMDLERMAGQVQRHIDDLEDTLSAIDQRKSD